MTQSDRTVQIDATIDLKDYFYAYLDAAKPRLIIACLMVALVIAGFTYFFILIGEREILWQLSPLFFGAPIVAIVGQCLRVHASFRKYIKDLSTSETNILFLFPEAGDGFDLVLGKDFVHIAWENVRSVIERPRYYRFVLNRQDSIIISKRFLTCGSDERLLKEIIALRVGNRAKLLA
jgi:hypothetical protein